METWDDDQVELCVRLGLITGGEYDEHMEEIAASLPRPARAADDELSRRRRRRRTG
jgi:hypothetical protein